MLAFVLALQFGAQKPDLKPNAELQQRLARAYKDLGPIRFGTRVSANAGRWNYRKETSTTILDTVFIDRQNFRIERRDLVQDDQDAIHTSAGVLWSVDGKISLWTSSDDGKRTTLTKLDDLRPSSGFGSPKVRQEPYFSVVPGIRFGGASEFGVDDFLCTYAHRALFGELDWLTTAWTAKQTPSGIEWKMDSGWPGQHTTIQLDSDNRITSESVVRPAMNEPGTDGWSMTATHRQFMKCPDAAKLIRFTPPRP